MKNIQLNNGENVIVNTLADAIEVIKERLSYELGNYIESECDFSELEEERDDWRECYEIKDRRNRELKSEIEDLTEEIRELKREIDDLQAELSKEGSLDAEIPEDEIPLF